MLDLEDDYEVFDLQEEGILLVNTPASLNIAEGKMVNEDSSEVLLSRCLFRQVSARTSGVVRQIFQRGVGAANFNVDTVDTVVEVWHKNEYLVKINDVIRRVKTNEEYEILGFDHSTGSTRYRCACRRIV